MQGPRRIFYGWWIVAAAGIGQSTSPGQFVFGSLGLFIAPLGAEFGWDRADVSLALTFFTIALVAAHPLVGRLVDRYGAREVLLPSVVVVGLGLAAVAAFVDSLWRLYAAYLLLGLLGAGANNLAYMRIVVAWFDRRRGLALGLTVAGSGLGYAYVPPLLNAVIGPWGWRAGYLALAGITLLVAAPLLALVLRNAPADRGLAVDGIERPASPSPPGAVHGIACADAVRGPLFWRLAAVFAVASFCLYGLLAHFVPLLTDRGMSTQAAAFAAALIGVTITVSRVVIGYLIDRIFAPRVALGCFLLAALGFGALALGATGAGAYGVAVAIGLAIGVEIDLLAYLTSRYFGLKAFGAIYALLFASLLIGISFGPFGYGAVYEATGAYTGVLAACAMLLVLSAAAIGSLPRFPGAEPRETQR